MVVERRNLRFMCTDIYTKKKERQLLITVINITSKGVFVWDYLLLERLDGKRQSTFTNGTEPFRNEKDEVITELYAHV